MKFLKFFLITLFLLLSITYLAINFIHTKMEEEYLSYYYLSNKIEQLNDTYYLCVGLLQTNATKENINSCNLVREKIESTVEKMKSKTPFIYYYTKYILYPI